jgi:hypothetical protein
MKNSCGSFKHMRAVDGKQNLQFHWPKMKNYCGSFKHMRQWNCRFYLPSTTRMLNYSYFKNM